MCADKTELGKQLTDRYQALYDAVYEAHGRHTGKRRILISEMEAVKKECKEFRDKLYALSVSDILKEYLEIAPDGMAVVFKNHCDTLEAIYKYEHAVGVVFSRGVYVVGAWNWLRSGNPTFGKEFVREAKERVRGIEERAYLLRLRHECERRGGYHSVSGGYRSSRFLGPDCFFR